MTTIELLFGRPKADGTLGPASGTLIWTPTMQHAVIGSPDAVVLPLPFTAIVPTSIDGVRAEVPVPFSVNVEPTGASWVWKVEENFAGLRRRRAYYLVPDSATPLDYTDLIAIDPATLSSPEGPSPFPSRLPFTVSPTPPANPLEGDVWFDISSPNP